ncbi:MAG: heavy metal translocating P-type ATPase [Methylococcaceae bacterium]|nr:heavy metal translocating P-type ATPase [Methylococcaceae bacterium]
MAPLVILAGSLVASTGVKLFRSFKKPDVSLYEAISDDTHESTEHMPSIELVVTEVDEKKALERDFKIISATMGVAIAGALFVPALSVLSGIGIAYVSIPFYQKAYQSLKKGKVDIFVVDSIAIPAMFLSGFYFVSTLACWTYCLAQQLVYKTKDHSKKQLISVFSDLPSTVWVIKNGIEIEQGVENLESGDIVVVNAGETIAVDGTVVDGMATVDQHVLTGESQPAEKAVGDRAFASTIVLSGKIHIQVELSGQTTVAAQIAELLNNTAERKLGVQTRGEKMADKAALPTLALSALAMPIVGISGALAVLGSFIGSDIRIFAPISTLNFLKIASEKGILIKDGRALEKLSQVDTVVFDKTGTLTEEQPHVGHIYVFNGYSETDVLHYAATAEYKQTHPIAKAILQAARQRQIELTQVDNASYELGYGIKVLVGEDIICVGSLRFMEMENVALSEDIYKILNAAKEQGYSLVLVGLNGRLTGALELHATLRPEVKELIAGLHARNLTTYIISGDNEKPTQRLAQEIGIDNYFAEVLPEDKASLIEKLQDEGRTVCFVGDGINDSIALKRADVSISLANASSIAIDTAQILLMSGNLSNLEKLFELSKEMDANLNVSMMATVVPGVVIVSGVFFLHTGVISAVILNNCGLFAGVSNSMMPLIKHQKPDDKAEAA